MQAHPDVDPISKDAPRVGLNLPNPYWTLTTPFATFIGMYTNVPEGVTGNGGYHNLHALHSKAGDVASDTGAVLRYGNDKTWGFLTLVIDGKTIRGTTTQVDKNGEASQGDSFSYPVKPVTIANKMDVPTL